MKIRYLLLNAYGKGGTIRTVFNQAGSMAAAGHDVEVVSVVRRRKSPRFPLDRRVRVTAIVDTYGSPPAPEPSAWTARFAGQGRPSRYVPRGEIAREHFTRDVETRVIRWMQRLRGGALVTTRPALNILAAQHASTDVLRVGQEHMNLGTHPRDVRAAILRHYPRFDAVAVLTERDREEYAHLLPGTRVVCIPNAVHAGRKRQSSYANRIVAAAGRLKSQKGFDLLIPAFAQAAAVRPGWQLRIFGTGDKEAQLRGLIETHHVYNSAFLMGFTPHLDDELAKASVFALSSRFEGLPMVMIEAMTHGLPVVSYDCPTGPADVITDGREGLLVPPRDVDAFAVALGELMDDEGLRADMGTASLARSRRYAPEAVHPRWEELFTTLAAEAGPRRRLVRAAAA
ncbi:glycosyltransferase family 4 protein [Streptomyces sp. MAR4 CNX-425]|uniref:glycosyltransferase family 4 protein n=1 Tax=Streptomyces sp. MAR4 CNX-425 TaxID=3406343 RepID=UPI003B5049A3